MWFFDPGRTYHDNEGPCPQCKLTLHIGEDVCPHCAHSLSKSELAALENYAARHQKMMDIAVVSSLIIFVVFIAVSLVVSFIT